MRPPLAEGNATDYEYKRLGTCNVFMANEPLAGKRRVEVTERKTKTDWALFAKSISEDYPEAEKITLVMDNFATHNASAFYEAFEPEQAKRLWDRFDFVFTPKHGSWLNMAEIELNVLIGQCLNRRIARLETVRSEVQAWQKQRDSLKASINWRFTNEGARIKLKRLYPTGVIESEVSSWTSSGPIGDWRGGCGVGTWHGHCRRSTKRRLS